MKQTLQTIANRWKNSNGEGLEWLEGLSINGIEWIVVSIIDNKVVGSSTNANSWLFTKEFVANNLLHKAFSGGAYFHVPVRYTNQYNTYDSVGYVIGHNDTILCCYQSR